MLSLYTKNLCKSTTYTLFDTDVETFNLQLMISCFCKPQYKIRSCSVWELIPERSFEFKEDKDDITCNCLNKRQYKNAQTYNEEQKKILLEDKIYLLSQSQEESRQITIDRFWKIVHLTASTHLQKGYLEAFILLNNPLENRTASPIDNPTPDSLTVASFAFLLLFLDPNLCLALEKYLS